MQNQESESNRGSTFNLRLRSFIQGGFGFSPLIQLGKNRFSKSNFLKSNYLENPEFDKFIAERSIFLIASIAEPLDAMYSGAYQVDSPENIIYRVIISLLGTLLFASSFVLDFVKQNIQQLARLFCYVFIIQIAYLNVVYGFTYDYALLYTGALIVLSIYFRKTSSLVFYLLFAYLLAIFASYIAEDHQIGRNVFIGRLVLATFASFGMAKMNNVLQDRVRNTNKALINTIKDIETLSAVATYTDNAVMVMDADKRIEWINAGFEQLSGKSSKEIIGIPVSQLFATDLETQKAIEAELNKNKSFSKEFRRKKGKAWSWFKVQVNPVFDKKENIQRYIWVELDITERVKTEKELVETTKVAQEAARLKQEFLANMSHEIRTPMNAILGFSQLLEKTKLNKTQSEYLESIRTSSNNLLVIINDILDFSKIEAGKLHIEYTNFNLDKLLHNSKSMFTPTAKEKDLDFLIDKPDDVPAFLIGDPVRLSQIITNLVSNALKFTLKGHVKIGVKKLSGDDKNIKLEIRISDTGIGIAKEKQASVFQSFTQAEGDTTRKFGGTGLGLTIVKSLIELMEGSIRLESELGSGSSFIVELPFKIDARAKERMAEEAAKAKSIDKVSGVKVLYAEDNRANQFIGKKMLGDLGYHVTIANNGKEAVDLHQSKDFDVILMDIQMPEMDGVEATIEIRKLASDKKFIPIIALTAHALKEEKDRYLASGMNDYETKPFNIKELHSKVLKWVNANK